MRSAISCFWSCSLYPQPSGACYTHVRYCSIGPIRPGWVDHGFIVRARVFKTGYSCVGPSTSTRVARGHVSLSRKLRHNWPPYTLPLKRSQWGL